MEENIFASYSFTSPSKSRSPGAGKLNICDSGDIEDSVPGSPEFWPVPLEKKTAILSKRREMNMNNSSSTAAPPSWQDILEKIRKMRVDRDAPVDLLGPEQLVDRSKDADTQKFHILVAAMLSSQTRDATTAAAMKRLHAMPGGFTVQRVAEDDLSVGTLEELLYPVGFYRQKAKHLKTIATMLMESPYCGSVPSTLSELLKFPGVGPKVGLLVLSAAFGKNQEGLICDSNVLRVCSRLGWVPEDSTPDKTRRALEIWLPKDLWTDLSYLFVGFGQQVPAPGIQVQPHVRHRSEDDFGDFRFESESRLRCMQRKVFKHSCSACNSWDTAGYLMTAGYLGFGLPASWMMNTSVLEHRQFDIVPQRTQHSRPGLISQLSDGGTHVTGQ